jgi:hypothetical protein
MRRPDLAKALESFSSLMTEKVNLSEKECLVIEKLNRAMNAMGYRILPMDVPPERKRRGRSRVPRNRKHMLHVTSHNGIGKMAKRGPGRPRLRKVA